MVKNAHAQSGFEILNLVITQEQHENFLFNFLYTEINLRKIKVNLKIFNLVWSERLSVNLIIEFLN